MKEMKQDLGKPSGQKEESKEVQEQAILPFLSSPDGISPQSP